MLEPKDFAEKIGVTVKTLQNWDDYEALKQPNVTLKGGEKN